jgi:sulfur carrier protein
VPEDVHEAVTVSVLLASRGLDLQGVAVAVDRQVVRRGDWESMTLADGQEVEIVRAVGGG